MTSKKLAPFAFALCALSTGMAHATLSTETDDAVASPVTSAKSAEGVQFVCKQATPAAISRLEEEMAGYLASLGIKQEWVTKESDGHSGVVTYTLATPETDTDTLTLSRRKEYAIHDEVVTLPTKTGTRDVKTASRKEIVLALMQHGRLTRFEQNSCDTEAFIDHVNVRQNIAAWAERLQWGWPDGEKAKWNSKFWNDGTPLANVSVSKAVNDTFLNQKKYEIGCYTATKLVMSQGLLDYYGRIKKDAQAVSVLEANLMQDGEPIIDVEPHRMWSFEPQHDASLNYKEGKLVTLQYGVASNNFVPGDWSYFYNTDAVTYGKTGYEGSNAVYLGRNRFDDYYNDNHHRFSFRQKIDEVYQWRNGVFSRSRDAKKIQPLTNDDIARLSHTPEMGGLLIGVRASPYLSVKPVLVSGNKDTHYAQSH